MPKRTDINSVLVLGPGPIVIGQACEFDYSGTQACKVLKQEGYRVILVNSNPATIMTDPGVADATYIEPINPKILSMVIRQEAPDAVLANVGGQTALNNALRLYEDGTLEKYGVELIGVNADSIRKAEDRQVFAKMVEALGLRCPKHKIVVDKQSAQEALRTIGVPAVIRPSYTLGGFGGGVANTEEDFFKMIEEGIRNSPKNQVQVDESLVGWKEFELEMVRDKNDNCIVVCGIENIDPMGIHTGDSITVAPILTLRDREYQKMRDFAIQIMRAVGIDTGGANVQFAVKDDQLLVIEMNPRVSRSSALASKATGFPIAKVSAKLAVGYTLDEVTNDCVPVLSAAFEPSLDYVVTKIPRFDFEKFVTSQPILHTQMQSIGEVMAIGRSFAESLQKAFASLEPLNKGLNPILAKGTDPSLVKNLLGINHPQKMLLVADALRLGVGVKEISTITNYDCWFIDQIHNIVQMEALLGSGGLDAEILMDAKKLGFTDARIADIAELSIDEIRQMRAKFGVKPVFKRVDNCAGEFSCSTQYLYGCYEGLVNGYAECEARPSKRNKVIVVGSGPNQIGQGIEFDYACVHALQAIKNNGFESIMVNCNPETVSTDYDVSNKLYFSPLTDEHLMDIIDRESASGKVLGVIIQLGGQTPIALGENLVKNKINILGTSYASVDISEDREKFQALITGLGFMQPDNTICYGITGLAEACARIGFPVMVRPSYVLGGRAMRIIANEEELMEYLETKGHLIGNSTVLVDKFLEEAKEVDVDAICDGTEVYVAAILEHIESAGIHSGDSACSIPPRTIGKDMIAKIQEQTTTIALKLKVVGLINIQYAILGQDLYIIEVNLRASRTIPFTSKALNYPLSYLATTVMLGSKKLSELSLKPWHTIMKNRCAVKESVFPFDRFPDTDVLLGPEMQSTGEVMGSDINFPRAFAKAQMASGNTLPASGTVFISVRDQDKNDEILSIASAFVSLGFKILATPGTAEFLCANGIANTSSVNKVGQGKPDVVDYLREEAIHLVINTVSGSKSIKDSKQIRLTSILMKIPYCTTIAASSAVALAMKEMQMLSIRPIQSY